MAAVKKTSSLGRASLALTAALAAPALLLPAVAQCRPAAYRQLSQNIRSDETFSTPTASDAAFAPSGSDPQAVALLRLMLDGERNVSLAGTQFTQVNRNGRALKSQQNVVREGVAGLRMDYVQPRAMAGDEVVDNGTWRWRYMPSRNTLQTGPSTVRSLARQIRQLVNGLPKQMFLLRMLGPAAVAGHDCQEIEVDSQANPPLIMRRFWIDPTNGAQLRIEEYDNTGALQSVSYFTTVTYNPTIEASTFAQPKTPPNVTMVNPRASGPIESVVQAASEAGFGALQPQFLPGGFHFQSASVSEFNGRKVVGQRFTDGVGVISLFETPEINQSLTGIVHPRRGVAQATVGGLRVIVVGNVSDENLDQIVGSLR